MNYLEFLQEEKKNLILVKQSCMSAIEGYTNLKNEAQQQLNNLPEDIDRNTEYAIKYNQYLSERRSRFQQEISDYNYHIQGEQEDLNSTESKLTEIEIEINSIS